MSAYINPLTILALDNVDKETIKKARRRKLAEFDLSDDGLVDFNGRKLAKNDFLQATELLDTEQNIRFLRRLKEDLPLLDNFLATGDLAFFKNYKDSAYFNDSEFIAFLSVYFLQQYSPALLKAYKDKNKSMLSQLLRPTVFVDKSVFDKAYLSLSQVLTQQAKELEAIIGRVKEEDSIYDEDSLDIIPDKIENIVSVDILNLLPAYFQSARNAVALAINQIGAAVFNKHEVFEVPLELLDRCEALKIDGNTLDIVRKNKKQLLEMQEKERKEKEFALVFFEAIKILKLIIELDEGLEARKISLTTVISRLKAALDFEKLNRIPADLPEVSDWRDKLALRIRSMSIEAYNKHDNLSAAKELLAMAKKLTVSSTAAARIRQDDKALEEVERDMAHQKDKIAKDILEVLQSALIKIQNIPSGQVVDPEGVEKMLNGVLSDEHLLAASDASPSLRIKIIEETKKFISHCSFTVASAISKRLEQRFNKNKDISITLVGLKTALGSSRFPSISPLPPLRTRTHEPTSIPRIENISTTYNNTTVQNNTDGNSANVTTDNSNRKVQIGCGVIVLIFAIVVIADSKKIGDALAILVGSAIIIMAFLGHIVALFKRK